MRKQRWRRMQGVAGVLLLPLAFSVSATTGNINPSTYSYSRAYGVTEREAAQRQSATVMAGQLERQLQTLHPDTFAGLYIEHMPDFRVVVKFTSTPAHTLQGFTTDLRYKAEIAPQSLEMMLAVQDEGDAQLRSAGIEFLSGIDIKRSMVTFHVKNVDSAARAMRHLLRAVDFVEILPTAGFVETTAISGGHRINGPAQDCTTGFNVFDADHELGVTTAGHCDNAVAYVGLSAPLVFQAENNQGDFDVQWHKEPSSGARQVQKNQIELVAGPTSTVDITSTLASASLPVGASICKSGYAGHYMCGTIIDKNSHSIHNNVIGNYIRASSTTGEAMSVGGDSGGPVFVGNAAAGIVHGRGEPGTPYRNDLFYMPIERISSLGLAVLTESFEIEKIDEVSGRYAADIPVAIDFRGKPKFPLTLSITSVNCLPSQPCGTWSFEFPEKIQTPFVYAWSCQLIDGLWWDSPPMTAILRSSLKDASGVQTSAVEHKVNCSVF